MINLPTVSVVMPVYNAEKYLALALDSILGQTFCDFELIIVNDGSTDGSMAIVGSRNDERIVVVDEGHRGLPASLNRGISAARGKYIARMDGDDIALPARLEKQVAFLEMHPQVGILGTACRLIDAAGGNLGVVQWPADDLQIRWVSLLGTPFAHPTVVMRRETLKDNGLTYDDAFAEGDEDYDLWTRVLRYTSGANLAEPLLLYRRHSGVSTGRNEGAELRNHNAVALRTIEEQLGFPVTADEAARLRRLFIRGTGSDPNLNGQRADLADLHLRILGAFLRKHEGEWGTRQIRLRESLRVLRLVMRSPFKKGWLPVLRRLAALHAT